MKKKHPKKLFERDDRFLDQVIEKKYSSGLLSNAKWVTLMHTLVNHSSMIKECLVQPIWEETDSPSRKLMIHENIQHGFDFYDSSMESMVSGNPRGWYVYREIEWLDFPRITEKGDIQDLEAIAAMLKIMGEWVIERTDNNLRLLCYYRK